MFRRDFLKSAALVFGFLSTLGATRDDQDVLVRKLVFWVAGGRFYTMKSALKAGDRIDVTRESFLRERFVTDCTTVAGKRSDTCLKRWFPVWPR